MLTQLLLFLAILPSIVLTWWDVGHMLTATIAEKRLKEINLPAYAYFNDLITSINFLTDEKSQTFIESASWPDDIKSSKYNMHLWDAWHYKDLPHLTDGVFPVINFTEVTVNSINLVHEAVKVMKSNKQKNTAERALFARYLLHVIGDIHQPLHSVALYNQTFPSGDIGGNRIKIDLPNGTKNYNFHSFWDNGALRLQNESFEFPRPLSLERLSTLRQYADNLTAQYGDSVKDLAQIIDPIIWSKQSLEIAKNTSYPFVLENKEVTEEYSTLVHETCKKRVTLAGYRIANVAADIFSGWMGNKSWTDYEVPAPKRAEIVWEQLMKNHKGQIIEQ